MLSKLLARQLQSQNCMNQGQLMAGGTPLAACDENGVGFRLLHVFRQSMTACNEGVILLLANVLPLPSWQRQQYDTGTTVAILVVTPCQLVVP
jgi:hypothetical protein